MNGEMINGEMMNGEKPTVCLEMDAASGRDKNGGKRRTRLADWEYYHDFLKDIGGFATIAVEPQNAPEEVMRFLADHREVFLPTVHRTVRYGHYGNGKTEGQLREMWEWTVTMMQDLGFDMGLDGNGIFIPPMHMISDNAVDVLRSYGVKVIGGAKNDFPLGSRQVMSSRGEPVYNLSQPVEAYTPYRGVTFYKRCRPPAMKPVANTKAEVLELAKSTEAVRSSTVKIPGSYDAYCDMCEKDFLENCLYGDASFYAHEVNIGKERPFMGLLERMADNGCFDNVRFVNAKELSYKAAAVLQP
jgi:hypothetical protein